MIDAKVIPDNTNLAPNVGPGIVFQTAYALLFYRWTSRELVFQPKDKLLVQGHGKALFVLYRHGYF